MTRTLKACREAGTQSSYFPLIIGKTATRGEPQYHGLLSKLPHSTCQRRASLDYASGGPRRQHGIVLEPPPSHSSTRCSVLSGIIASAFAYVNDCSECS